MKIYWPNATTLIADDTDATRFPVGGSGWLGPDYRAIIQSEALVRAAVMAKFHRGNADIVISGQVERQFANTAQAAEFERSVCNQADVEGTLRFSETDGANVSLVSFAALLGGVRVVEREGVRLVLEYTFHATALPVIESAVASAADYECGDHSAGTPSYDDDIDGGNLADAAGDYAVLIDCNA